MRQDSADPKKGTAEIPATAEGSEYYGFEGSDGTDTDYLSVDGMTDGPPSDGGFVIDYFTPPGTSLAETNRQLLQAETILKSVPEVESYSRRTGARLALAIAEPNTGRSILIAHHHIMPIIGAGLAEIRHPFPYLTIDIQQHLLFLDYYLTISIVLIAQPVSGTASDEYCDNDQGKN